MFLRFDKMSIRGKFHCSFMRCALSRAQVQGREIAPKQSTGIRIAQFVKSLSFKHEDLNLDPQQYLKNKAQLRDSLVIPTLRR